MSADGQVLRTLAIHTCAGLVTAADLDLAPAALVEVRHHTVHADIQSAWPAADLARIAGVWLAVLLRLMLQQHSTELFGGSAHTIGADVNQGQLFENLGGLDK